MAMVTDFADLCTAIALYFITLFLGINERIGVATLAFDKS